MSYLPLGVLLAVLVIGAAVTLIILFRAERKGLFKNLHAGAYVIFDEEEPPERPQDQPLTPRETVRNGHRTQNRASRG